jgi:glycosyltransferase involved in cell wall biosynthesis
VDEAVEGLIRLAVDRELRTSIGEAARRRVKDSFSIENMVDAYSRLYRDLLNR